jgi:iron complex outermembrane receptor protein
LHYTKGQGYFEQYKADENLSDYGFTGPDFGTGVIDTSDLIRRRWLDNDFYGFTLSGQYNPNNDVEIIVGGAWSKYDGDHFGEIIWAEITGDAKIRDRYYDNNGLKTDYNVYTKGTISLGSSLTVFADVQYRGIDYTLLGLDNDGLFLDDNYTFSFLNPKVGISYFLDENQSLYASYSVANKEPSRADIIDNTTGVIPTHETLYDLEVGFRRSRSRFQVNTNFYYMNYRNQLVLTGELNDVGASLRLMYLEVSGLE